MQDRIVLDPRLNYFGSWTKSHSGVGPNCIQGLDQIALGTGAKLHLGQETNRIGFSVEHIHIDFGLGVNHIWVTE